MEKEGHISEGAGITGGGQNNLDINRPRPSSTESKGNNYFLVVNFNPDSVNNNAPAKDRHKNALCKETIREVRKEYNLRPRATKGKQDGCISIGVLAINTEPKPEMGRKSLLSKS